VHEYNSRQQEELHIIYEWEENWVRRQKEESQYDQDGNLLVKTMYYWITNAWRPSFKYEYQYDQQSHNIHKSYWEWYQSELKWVPVEKTEYTWNEEGWLFRTVGSLWNKITSKWEEKFKIETTRDNNSATNFSYVWNGYWMNKSKTIYQHNAQGKTELMTEYNWDNNTSSWQNKIQYHFGFDIEGNVNCQTVQNWDVNRAEWVNSVKIDIQIDGDSSFYSEYSWDIIKNDWKKYLVKTKELNEFGKQSFYQYKSWSNSDSTWYIYEQKDYEFDTCGNQIQCITSASIGNQLSPDYKEEREFNSSGNETSFIKYFWYAGLSKWIQEEKIESLYNPEGYLTQTSRYLWIGGNWIEDRKVFCDSAVYYLNVSPDGVEFNSEDPEQSELNIEANVRWLVENTTDWIHLDKTEGVDETGVLINASENNGIARSGKIIFSGRRLIDSVSVSQDGILDVIYKIDHSGYKIYPVPTNGRFWIKFEEINASDFKFEVYDGSGHLLLFKPTKMSENEIELDLSNKPAGIYLLRVVNNGSISQFKIAKK